MEHATSVMIDERDGRLAKPLTRYEDDAHAWAFEQAALLKAGRLSDLDIVHLADEIEDVGRAEYDKLASNLAIVIQHLLKWDYQPSRRSRSWVHSIREHRRRVGQLLKDNPSLKGRRTDALREAFERGRAAALIETSLPDDAFPETNRESWDETMTRPIAWPDP